jgi:ubiquitin carboxyl-terminal hydrolase 14
VKHQGKKYNVEVDPSANGETFKYQLYSLTGVEPDRQKILVKGGQLKNETELSKLGLKPGQTLMMMGTASGGPALEKPKETVRFIEDMTEAEAAQSEGAIPAGLQNLGNTCYMNSTIQALRSIPELQQQLTTYASTGPGAPDRSAALASLLGTAGLSTDLTANLRDLFKQMSETQEPFPPLMFLNALRSNFPQFAQRARDGHGYAQQDAEEAWSQIITQLRQKVKIKETVDGTEQESSFVDKYMAGTFSSVLECDDPAAKEGGEEPVTSTDNFFKLDCHITGETNHLRDGLATGLIEKIEKKSDVLDRDAVYTKSSKITRLPKYLTVHFMRFDWRKDTSKKAKIMRKVTFPQELDVVEFCAEDLSKILAPIRNKFREVRSIELDAERARKRQKRFNEGEEPPENSSKKNERNKSNNQKTDDVEMKDVEYKTDAQLEEERKASILAAKKELLELADPKTASDDTINHTGLYELRGIITHQGASADSGHYTAFVKKQPRKDPKTGKEVEDGKWWWFNDDKVSEYEPDRIDTLSGGGKSIIISVLYMHLS